VVVVVVVVVRMRRRRRRKLLYWGEQRERLERVPLDQGLLRRVPPGDPKSLCPPLRGAAETAQRELLSPHNNGGTSAPPRGTEEQRKRGGRGEQVQLTFKCLVCGHSRQIHWYFLLSLIFLTQLRQIKNGKKLSTI